MTSTRTQQRAQSTGVPAEQHEESRARTGHDGQGHGLHMHTAHANLPIPYFTPRDLGANAKAATSKLPSLASRLPGLPPPRRLAFYGGLGALVVAGFVDLPVAAAIGVATIVARARRGEEQRAPAQQTQAQQTREQPAQAQQPTRTERPAAAETPGPSSAQTT